MVMDTMNTIKTWVFNIPDGLREENKNKKSKSPWICWATQFKNILKLNKKEKHLVPEATITYCRPPTLRNQLTNYKYIAREDGTSSESRGCQPCNRCGLCGNFGSMQNMVLATDKIRLPNGKDFTIKSTITCKHQGIYAAKCIQCHQYYVGQTNNSFSTRWNAHRSSWKKMIAARKNITVANDDPWKDQNALFMHYQKNHPDKVHKNLMLYEAFQVIFIEKTKAALLDVRENYWISKLDASINISKTYLPKYK